MKVLLAAGGTAGHIEPALTLADTLVRDDPQTDIVVVGRDEGMESRLVPARGYRLRTIPAVPLPRRPSKDLALVPVRVSGSVRQVMAILREEKPDVVVGFGGYVALPAYLAARRAGIPLVIHEANGRAGLANRVGARLTGWTAENVPGSLPRATRVGRPLRPQIVDLAAAADRQERQRQAREHFGLEPDRPTLLVFGGSLGALHLNEVVSACADDLGAAGVQVLHVVGEKAAGVAPIAQRDPGRPRYCVVPYVDRMDLAYAAADLAVCRAGAMTCAELAAVGLPAVYVPLPVGNGEQRLNAQPVVNSGGGLIVDDADFTVATLRETVLPLIANTALLQRMSDAARQHGVRDADARLADLVRAAAATGGRS
ncbi:MAG: undecaprenyldiphospho-muramoylpentapeptide beta-N-acetylglucosaminyltransferase [Actinomycetota bacterium]